MKSVGHGCLATADATGAQATERFGKKEKVARLRFKRVLGATRERPHETHKAKKTKAKVQKKENKEQSM